MRSQGRRFLKSHTESLLLCTVSVFIFTGYFKLRNGWTSFLNKDTYINVAFSEVECIPEYNDEEYDVFVLTFEKKSLLSFFGVICIWFARNVGNVQKKVVFTVRREVQVSRTNMCLFVTNRIVCYFFLFTRYINFFWTLGGRGGVWVGN